MHPARPSAADHPDRLIRFGGGLLLAGMCCTLVAMAPILTNTALSPLWWLLPMAGCTAGLTTLLAGARAQARARSRAVAALRDSDWKQGPA